MGANESKGIKRNIPIIEVKIPVSNPNIKKASIQTIDTGSNSAKPHWTLGNIGANWDKPRDMAENIADAAIITDILFFGLVIIIRSLLLDIEFFSRLFSLDELLLILWFSDILKPHFKKIFYIELILFGIHNI